MNKFNKIIYVLLMLCAQDVRANTNSRDWVNIVQNMTGAQSSMTSTAFSAYNSIWPFKYYSLAVNVGVTVSPWSVLLEGSNDSTIWTTLATTTNGDGATGAVKFQSNAEPVLYLRVRANALGSGDTITATAVGVP